MKRFILLTALMAFWIAPLAAQTITVVSPNGGETLAKGGSPFAIEWTARNVDQEVKIVLVRENGDRFGLIAEDLAPDGSPYRWTVGETRSGEAPAGSYRVRVVSDDGAVKDESDRVFHIEDDTPPPSLSSRILSPVGGGTWPLRTLMSIRWETSGYSGTTELHLGERVAGSFREIGLIADGGPLSGDHEWLVGTYRGGTAEPRGNYQVAVYSRTADGRLTITASEPFTIGPEAGGGGHDFVISDPFLEKRSSGRGFRVKVTDRTGDFYGRVVLTHYCMKMGLGNAVRDERVLNLTRGVPQTVNLRNLRGTLFDNECGMDFVLQVNPDRAVAESEYNNNRVSGTFYWNRRDGRVAQVRAGRSPRMTAKGGELRLDRGDVEVSGSRITVPLEIMVRNCGREAIANAKLRVYTTKKGIWVIASDDAADHVVRDIDLPAGHMRLLNCSVTVEREADLVDEIQIYLLNGDDDAGANNNYNFTLGFNF